MSVNKFLYHYSNKEAINSIYDNQTIWLTNGSDFDDKSEKHLLKEIYFDVVKELKNRNGNLFYKQLPSEMQFNNTQSHYVGFGNSVFNEEGCVNNDAVKFQIKCETYIFCMSYDNRNDYLKANYTKDIEKVLEFDNDTLYQDSIDFLQKELPLCFKEEIKKEMYLVKLGQHIFYSSTKHGLVGLDTVYFKWGNVIYDTNKQKEIVKNLIVDYRDRFYKYSNDKNEKLLKTYINTLLYDLELSAYYMKKEDPFSNEKEFRLILTIPNNYSKVFACGNKKRIRIPVHCDIVNFEG
jgi:hypothetical protein